MEEIIKNDLAPRINEEHRACEAAMGDALQHAIRAGMTTLADRLSRMQRLVGCIERSTADPQVLVAARCILDEVTGAEREIEGGVERQEPDRGHEGRHECRCWPKPSGPPRAALVVQPTALVVQPMESDNAQPPPLYP